jgi:uncharacterized membrane protein
MNFLNVLRIIHVLGAVLWVGGMFFSLAVLRPSLQILEPPQRILVHAQVFRRFFLVVWHAMPLIILSGFIMLFVYYGGPAHVGWNVHLMLLAGLVMAGVFVGMVFGPYKTFRSTSDRPQMARSLNSIRHMIGFNLVLGMITIVVALLS